MECTILQVLYLCRSRLFTNFHFVVQDILFYWLCSSLRARTYQPPVDFISTSPETEVKEHLASLGMTLGQQVESLSRYWLSRTGLSLQISSYPNSLRSCVGAGPHCGDEPRTAAFEAVFYGGR